MEELLVKYGKLNRVKFEGVVAALDEMSSSDLEGVLVWLEKFKANEFKELQRIFNLPLNNSSNGKELWDRYFAGHRYNLIEVRAFTKQAKVCIKAWKEFFKSIKNEKTSNENTDSVSA